MGLLVAQFGNVFGRRQSFAFQHVGKLLWADGDRTSHEFGNVVALHELPMIVGVGSGQLKGFGALAVTVDVGNERTGIYPVIASAAEDEPPAVA